MVIADPANGGKQRKVANVPDVWAFGQGGLLDVVLDRNFSENNKIYFTYSDPGILRSAGTALASATLVNGGKPALQNVKKLYTQKKKTRAGQHFGSRIVQDRTGNIFFTIGDRENAPELKIHRIRQVLSFASRQLATYHLITRLLAAKRVPLKSGPWATEIRRELP